MMDFQAHAIPYAKMGWSVFPLIPGQKRPLPGTRGVKEATTDLAQIERWACDYPTANIGIGLGKSDLMGVDCDAKTNCWAMLAEWDKRCWRFPPTLIANTRDGGMHLYYAAPRGFTQTTHMLKKFARRGIDVRIGEMYFVLPPSEVARDDGTPSGYAWERQPVGGTPPLPPRWFLELLKRPPAPRFERGKGHGAAGYQGALKKLATTPMSGRNNTLNLMAHLLGREYVATGEVSYDQAQADLYAAAQASGLETDPNCGPHGIRATIHSGLQAGIAHAGKRNPTSS